MGRGKNRRFEKKKNKRQSIAKERIHILMEQARKQAIAGDLELASRYAQLARRIGMRYKVSMPPGFNLMFCRRCLTYLVPGKNSRTRINQGRLVRQCLKCGAQYRIPFGRN